VFACSPEAQVTPLKTARLEARWQKAVWFGKTDQSDEHIVVDKDGWRTCRTVARRPEDKRWNKKFFATVNVRSYEAARVATLKDAADDAGSRRRYLTRIIVGDYGASQHCKACADGVGTHTAECRARLERFIAESEAEKLTAAADTLAPAAVDAAAAGEVDVPMSSGARGSNDPMEVAAAPAQEEMQIDLTADLVADQAGTTRIADAEPTEIPESKRQRTIGGNAVFVSSPSFMIAMIPLAVCSNVVQIPGTAHWCDDLDVYGAKSGELLLKDLVKAGRATERAQMACFQVYERVRAEDMDPAGKRIPVRTHHRPQRRQQRHNRKSRPIC
jgi:hypothetical protein